MSTTLTPYLTFRGTASEALDFYAATFGGSVQITTFGEFGEMMAGPEYAGKVMHGTVKVPGGFSVIVADLPPGDDLSAGNNVTIFVNNPDAEEVRRHWKALSKEGTVVLAFETQMWGDEYGRCVDRWWVTWHLSVSTSA